MSIPLSYETLGRDGLAEIVNQELDRIRANIEDPNTDPKKQRKLVIEVAFKPNEQRNFADMTYVVKPTMAPVKPVVVTTMIEGGDIHIPQIGTNPAQHELPINNPKVTQIKEAQNG